MKRLRPRKTYKPAYSRRRGYSSSILSSTSDGISSKSGSKSAISSGLGIGLRNKKKRPSRNSVTNSLLTFSKTNLNHLRFLVSLMLVVGAGYSAHKYASEYAFARAAQPARLAAILSSEIELPPFPQDLNGLPAISSSFQRKILELLNNKQIDTAEIALDNGDTAKLTIDPMLQNAAHKALARYSVDVAAIVALNPKTGKVLALASRDNSVAGNNTQLATLQSTFPAASIFKVITASAAIERAGMNEHTVIPFRGGNYTLNKYNYLPDKKRDARRMMLGEAFGKSCNPVFARVALNSLDSSIVDEYAEAFSFNRKIPFELEVGESSFEYPKNDYALARTSAGFENSFISPLHGALIAASIVNNGNTMAPYIVEKMNDPAGDDLYTAQPRSLQRSVLPSTAKHLLEIMEYSSEMGTAKRYLKKLKDSSGKRFKVVGKTGTLSGKNPEGRYHWFVGATPQAEQPIAIASLVIDRGQSRINGTGLAKSFLQEAYGLRR